MALRIASWNVNSVRSREAHLERFLSERAPDVICLQETKVEDPLFPLERVTALGYRHHLIHGQKSYNGVAILSRVPFEDQGKLVWCRKDDCRHLWVRLPGDVELHNFYVPSGGPTPDPAANDKFDHKIKFLKAMASWCRKTDVKNRRVILVGDLNVAPLETDVWNHKKLLRSVGHTPLESELMLKLHKAGKLEDVPRRFVPPSEPLFTWWGYRFPQSFAKDYGWRLDHVLAAPPLAGEIGSMEIVKETRTWERPADHVPVMVELA